MVKLAPPLDGRTAEDIVQQVKQLLSIYLPDRFAADRPLGSNNEALVRIFAHYGELMLQRLNQTPEKNFLAFLNLLGSSQLPPQPARVPLTFYLSTGSEADAAVPIGTQVAALPEKGKSDPTIFETERELIVTATQLKSLWSHDPAQDRYTDHRQLLQVRATSAESVFQGKSLLEHTLYLGHSQILGHEHLQTLDILWKLEKPLEDERSLQWQIWNGANWEVITPSVDETNGLRQSGKLSFSNLKTVPVVAVHSQQNHWIRGRLTTPIVNSNEPRSDSVRVSQLPVVSEVSLRTDLSQSNLKPEAAFTNTFPLDFSKPFFPLGEKPAFGDTFYLACRPAFGQIDARIKLKVSLMDHSIKPSANLKLVWEYSQGQQWVVLGSSTTAKDASPTGDLFNFKDGTFALTKSGEVEFTIPAEQKSAIATLNGVENIWLRVRIEEGNYGLESQIRPNLSDSGKLQDPPILFGPATFAPPCIREIAISYQLEQTATQTTAEAIALAIENNFQFTTAQVPFAPFQPSPDENPALYLGFQPPVNQRFPNRVLSLYVAALVSEYRPDVQHDHSSSARLIWEYWDGFTWQTLTVEDSTRALTHSGLVEFLVPESFLVLS
jgi:hypothetical protein